MLPPLALVVLGTVATGLACSLNAGMTWPWSLIGWVAFVPWLAALDRLASRRAAAAAGVLMSIVFAVAVFPWFAEMVADYSAAPSVLAYAIFLLAAPLLQPQLVVFATARAVAAQAAPGVWWLRAIVGAGFYVGAEWMLPKMMGDTLGHGQYPSLWVRQSADLFGAHGLTFVMLLVNESVLALARRVAAEVRPGVRRPVVAPAAICAVAMIGLSAYGALRVRESGDEDAAAPIRVAIVQANVEHYDRLKAELGTFDAVGMILEAHFSMSAQALRSGDVDLLLWPETIYPTTFGAPKSADGAGFDRAIAAFVAQQGVPLVFGTYDRDGEKEYNAAALLEAGADGGVGFDVYRKSRLFPFTEYLPWFLDSPGVRAWLPWAGTWSAGDGARVLPLTVRGGRTVNIAPLICYDAIDPTLAVAAVRGGAEALVTLSNDSWFDYPGARELILVVSAFRSVETRRPQVRATPTGLSAVIDSLGNVTETIEPNQSGVLVGAIRPRRGPRTVAVALGNWLPPAALSVAMLALVIPFRSVRRLTTKSKGKGPVA